VRENRAYLKRTVSYLAREAGIRQFLDIGTGLPTADNTHEVAQAIAPDARIVYVDNDPIVLTHARALLTSTRDGATAYIDADVRDPARILADPQMHETLDLSKPVGLVLLAIMHFIDDTEDPHAIVAQLVSALAPGSYLVMSHATYDPMPPEIVTRLKAAIAGTGEKGGPRDREQFAKFFAGLDLVDPGVVPIGDWRPTPGTPVPDPADVGVYGAVARIP
jgi:SAM-dependent methyltransferase